MPYFNSSGAASTAAQAASAAYGAKNEAATYWRGAGAPAPVRKDFTLVTPDPKHFAVSEDLARCTTSKCQQRA